jgi:hypothetical protein
MRGAGGRLKLAVLLGLATARAAAADTPPEPPPLLSRTGLYAGSGGSSTLAEGVRTYSPQYPLWSDGAEKSRWVWLPPHASIDTSDPDRWEFPVGTRFWKQFVFDGRKVETRFLWKAGPEEWVFATYLWTEDQQDALLAPEQGIPGYREIAPSRRLSIPSRTDCLACHASAGQVQVLGFNALQLSDDRDPLAPHAVPPRERDVTLGTLVAEDILRPRRPEWIESPPRIAAGTPTSRAALGYLSANCGGCHNADGPLRGLGMILRHDVSAERSLAGAEDGAREPGLRTTWNVPGTYQLPGIAPGESRRISPGRPESSTLLYRMSSRRPSSQMPPLGSVLVDQEAVDLVRAWILEQAAFQDQLPAGGTMSTSRRGLLFRSSARGPG